MASVIQCLVTVDTIILHTFHKAWDLFLQDQNTPMCTMTSQNSFFGGEGKKKLGGFENVQIKLFYFVPPPPPFLRALFVESEGELSFHPTFQGFATHHFRLFSHVSRSCLMGEEFIISYGGITGHGSVKHCLWLKLKSTNYLLLHSVTVSFKNIHKCPTLVNRNLVWYETANLRFSLYATA